MKQDNYTDKSWEDFVEARTQALAILEKEDADQSGVDESKNNARGGWLSPKTGDDQEVQYNVAVILLSILSAFAIAGLGLYWYMKKYKKH